MSDLEKQGETPRMNAAKLRLLDGTQPRDAVFVEGQKLERELAQMARDLADANHWRERHSNDSEARGKQSHEHWLKWQAAERLVNELEAKLAEAQLDAERYRATKWALIFHLDADDAGAAAEKLDADVDATVKKYLTLHTNAALAAERKESGNG